MSTRLFEKFDSDVPIMKSVFIMFLRSCVLIFVLVLIYCTISWGLKYRYYYRLYSELRIDKTIQAFDYAANFVETNPVNNYLYSDVMFHLRQATADSLSTPHLIHAKISYHVARITGRAGLIFHMSWIESFPSIDGICVHLPSGQFVTKLDKLPYSNEYGHVLFSYQQNFMPGDPQWDKWKQTFELLKTQPVQVSLIRNNRILPDKVELQQVPFPFTSTSSDDDDINQTNNQ